MLWRKIKAGLSAGRVQSPALRMIVEREEASWALDAARERLAKEAGTRSQLAAGVLGLDLYGLRAKLVDMGVEFIDEMRPRYEKE